MNISLIDGIYLLESVERPSIPNTFPKEIEVCNGKIINMENKALLYDINKFVPLEGLSIEMPVGVSTENDVIKVNTEKFGNATYKKKI